MQATVELPEVVLQQLEMLARREGATPGDLICLTGSLQLAGEALRWIKANLDDPLARAIVVAGDDH